MHHAYYSVLGVCTVAALIVVQVHSLQGTITNIQLSNLSEFIQYCVGTRWRVSLIIICYFFHSPQMDLHHHLDLICQLTVCVGEMETWALCEYRQLFANIVIILLLSHDNNYFSKCLKVTQNKKKCSFKYLLGFLKMLHKYTAPAHHLFQCRQYNHHCWLNSAK